ncbi:G-type lectin S-receptor-like serine/threonine-protein kinase LECRK1 [Quercus lobata]|uniref:G-type lectin S-receptor-like serine/threonine-protein kinase LECRK1 n=1 Tax=Quercus lobata TaxID=97700 RepID=UPI0012481890|nr:G-type lectin S-receptor-like serine/threonine-protein kinase LECRK1 [Quercus lobata]
MKVPIQTNQSPRSDLFELQQKSAELDSSLKWRPNYISFEGNQCNKVGCNPCRSQLPKPIFMTNSSSVLSRVAASSKTRIRWTQDLHNPYVECVNRLGGADRLRRNSHLPYSNVMRGSLFSNVTFFFFSLPSITTNNVEAEAPFGSRDDGEVADLFGNGDEDMVVMLQSEEESYTEEDCNIRLDKPLVAGQNSNPITSRSKEFAFGFHPLESEKENQFLLAVWFYKTKEPTIVWSANGNKPAPENSELRLSSNNEFVLYDHEDNELWKAPTPRNSKSSCAAIGDNGNLVILDQNNNSVWESFKEPTDTILPGQILYMNTTLRSRESETNYSKGRFQLSFQIDGNFVLYSLSMPSEALEKAYFATGTTNWESQLNFTEDGYMYIQDANFTNRVYNLTKESPAGSKEDFYYLARIDYDGGFRLYKHPRKVSTPSESCSSSWTVVQSIPSDICATFTGDAAAVGGGFCGPNGYCRTAGDSSGSGPAFCFCPPGFSPLDQSNNFAGCKPDFLLPSCQIGWEKQKENMEFKLFQNVNWPFTDYGRVTVANEAECRQLCLDDCLCIVVIYEGNGNQCWKKKYPLSNGMYIESNTSKVLIKTPKNIDSDKKHQSMVVVLALLLGSSAFLNILFFLGSIVAILYLYHKRLNSQWNIDRTLTTNVRSYTYKELEEVTRGFRQTVGKGAFGTVYKGVLPSDSKRFVAVKKLGKVVEEGEKEFKTEVSVIGQTHHKNLVRLLGYCDEGQHRLLVYEYMSNGSLASFLFGISRPHWNQRVQIAFGIARGLMYLHEECSTQIIHCDIKPQNILLDEYFTPRIADFGLAKLLLADQSRAARTAIRGTIGYFAPEWFRKASISVKVDVYSFGVMLLEIICCKSSVAFALGEEEALIDWAYECYKDKKLDKLIEDDEEAKNDMKRLERFVIVAIWCIQEDPSLRPSMKKITQMLEGVIEVSVPPSPSLFTSSPPSFKK